jgi:ribosomal protein L6P/L9E
MPMSGGKRRGATVKTLKRVLKRAGLKTTGRKAALTRRAKKAHLKIGGQLTTAVSKAADTARGVVGVGEALVKAPIKGVKAALNN